MGRINEYIPQSGRIIRENDSLINRADYAVAARESDVVQSSRDGTHYRSFFQGNIPSGATYWFAIDIPAGVTVYGTGRVVTVEEGSLRVQYRQGGALGAVQESYAPRNFAHDGPPAAASLRRYDTITGSLAHSPDALITAPTTGPIRQPSTQTAIGLHVKLASGQAPVFRLSNDTGAPIPCTLYLTWQELSD